MKETLKSLESIFYQHSVAASLLFFVDVNLLVFQAVITGKLCLVMSRYMFYIQCVEGNMVIFKYFDY